VITIFLDEERFLAEAVESVLAQTYRDWELLLCDDGSTDGSSRMASEYAGAQPDRVRHLDHADHANRGMSAARNLGIANARGRYFAFLDADDIWEPEKLEWQVELLDEHPDVAIVYGPSRIWHGWTGDPVDGARDYYRRLGFAPDRVVRGRVVLSRILRGSAESPGTCSVLVRADAARAVGGFEERFRGMYEDQAFFAKLFLEQDAYITGVSHDRYRQHPDSTCQRAIRSGEHHAELPSPARLEYLRWLREYLTRRNADRRLRAVVAREIFFSRHDTLARLRYRVMEGAGRTAGRVAGAGIGLGRRILPQRLRERLWGAWSERRRAGAPTAAGPIDRPRDPTR
jgi:glycosyltransferase involved in cell wall biosynthesis